MNNFDEQFRHLFPLEEDEVVAEFFSWFIDFDFGGQNFLQNLEPLLDGKDFRFDAVLGCTFNVQRQQHYPIQGVLFDRDLSLGDERNAENYVESLVPYHTFLDMARVLAQCRLQESPDDKTEIERMFCERNLSFSLDSLGKGKGDSGKTWWQKIEEKRVRDEVSKKLTHQ
ncbi:MAG TPA: hypothetical protein VGB45_09750 [Abditibacterium sp.]|jgi:hypothetical protein